LNVLILQHGLKRLPLSALLRSTLLTLVFSFFTISNAVATELIKVSSDPWEPWVLGEEGGVASGGIAVDLSNELFRRLGLSTETKIYPYKRCINQMKSGERDLLLMVKRTPEREIYMLFSDVAATDPQLIYYSTDHYSEFSWKSWEDLKGYTIAGVRGFDYGGFHQAASDLNLNFELAANDTQNIKKLLSGRVDLILLSQSTANFYLKSNPEVAGKLIAAERIVTNAEFHFGISKSGNATLHLDNINKMLSEMKQDGSLYSILGQGVTP